MSNRFQSLLPRLTVVAVTTVILSNLLVAIGLAGYQVYHDGLIYPGVSVWNADLSGMTMAEATDLLEGRFNYPQATSVTLTDGDNEYTITAAELGVRFDVVQTVQSAYEVGRHPSLITSVNQQSTAWRQGVVISPVIVYEQEIAAARIQTIALDINQPMVDAQVQLDGLVANPQPSQTGREVSIPGTLVSLEETLLLLEGGQVPIMVEETPPTIASAQTAAEKINMLLSTDLILTIPETGAEPLAFSPAQILDMLVIERVPAAEGSSEMVYNIRLDEVILSSYVTSIADNVRREPVDASFEFDDETSQLVPLTASQNGRALNVDATVRAINEAVAAGETRAPLVFDTLEPTYSDTMTGEELGVTEMIASATTYYAGSSQSRQMNIAEAASRFHGVLIEPGGTFSFNEHLGDVSLESGFEEALIIYNGRTIEGVGGGVCQVSTTAFQAAFYAGFPITERTPHAYSVSYYEVGEGVGMDATVYSPIVDLKFTNDTAHHLLVETYVDTVRAQLTFRFYSTSDGRTVQKDGPYQSNVVEPGPPVYEENPELSPGETKQVEYAANGVDVTVNRIVYDADGNVMYSDSFVSRYIPWQAVYQVGPGTETN